MSGSVQSDDPDGNTWIKCINFNSSSSWFTPLYVNQHIFIFPDRNDKFNHKITQYDIKKDQCIESFSYPQSVSPQKFGIALDTSDNSVYIVGENDFMIYNPNSKQFEIKEDFIHTGDYPAICYIHKYKQLHIIGGDKNQHHMIYSNGTLQSVQSPFHRLYGHGITFCNQTKNIFVFGGQITNKTVDSVYYCRHNDNGSYHWNYNDLYKIPKKLKRFGYVVHNDRYIILFGGIDECSLETDQIFYFDMIQFKWYKSSVVCPVRGVFHAIITDENIIHLFECNANRSHYKIKVSFIMEASVCLHRSCQTITELITIEDINGFIIRSQFGQMNTKTPVLYIKVQNNNAHFTRLNDIHFEVNYLGLHIKTVNVPMILSLNSTYVFYLELIIEATKSSIGDSSVADLEWFDCSARLSIETNVFTITTSLSVPMHLFLICDDITLEKEERLKLWNEFDQDTASTVMFISEFKRRDLTHINMKVVQNNDDTQPLYCTMLCGAALLIQLHPKSVLIMSRNGANNIFARTLCAWCIKQHVENKYIIHQRLRSGLYDDPYHEYLLRKGFNSKTYHSSVPDNIWLFDLVKIYHNISPIFTDMFHQNGITPDFMIAFNIVHFWSRIMIHLPYTEWSILEQIALYTNNKVEYAIDFHEQRQVIGINVTHDFQNIMATTSAFAKKHFIVNSKFIKMNDKPLNVEESEKADAQLEHVKSHPPSSITLRVNRNAFDIGYHFKIDIKISNKFAFPYYRFKQSAVIKIFQQIAMFSNVDIYHMSITEGETFGLAAAGFIPDKTDQSKIYFDSFNGYVLKSLLFKSKMFIGLTGITMDDVSIECGHFQSGTRYQTLNGGFSDTLKETHTFNRCTRLIWSTDEHNKDVWYLVVFNCTASDPLLQFAVQLDANTFPDLNDYGGIVYSGYGKDAPEEYKELIKREFFLKGHKTPNVNEEMDVRYIKNGVRHFQQNRCRHED